MLCQKIKEKKHKKKPVRSKVQIADIQTNFKATLK